MSAPKDCLGRKARPMRYPIFIGIKISQDAADELKQMAAAKDMKVGKIVRRAVMKDLYIWKAQQKKGKK